MSHMHIGALVVAEGPAPAYDDLLDSIRRRLHLVPRYRQRLVFPPRELGRPLWIDDTDFNLEYHVRHTALPSPGSHEQLQNLCARVFSQQLDRSKPLWEMWLIEGLDDGSFGLLTKTHHAMIDGIAGVDLATVLFDLGPEPTPVDESHGPVGPRARRPTPSTCCAPAPRAWRRPRCRSPRRRWRRCARPTARWRRARRGRGHRRDRVGRAEPRAARRR